MIGSTLPESGGLRKLDWPEAYAILTIEANSHMAPYSGRQMAVLKREQRLDWLDSTSAEHELFRPLPTSGFRVKENRGAKPRQGSLPL